MAKTTKPQPLISYAGSLGLEPFDWHKAFKEIIKIQANDILAAESNDCEGQWLILQGRAGDWRRSFSAELSRYIDRTASGEPRDEILRKLLWTDGLYNAICLKDVKLCLHLVDLIERRAHYLLIALREEQELEISDLKKQINIKFEIVTSLSENGF